MQGLVDFTSQVGEAFAILVPTFCYLAALACFLFAAWGFWMQSHPQNPSHGVFPVKLIDFGVACSLAFGSEA